MIAIHNRYNDRCSWPVGLCGDGNNNNNDDHNDDNDDDYGDGDKITCVVMTTTVMIMT